MALDPSTGIDWTNIFAVDAGLSVIPPPPVNATVIPAAKPATPSTSTWTDITKGITSILNSAFPVVWSFTGAGQAASKAATATAAAAKPATANTPAQLQQVLLIAGIGILAVVVALAVFKKQAA